MLIIMLGILAGVCFILNKSINMLLSNETGVFASNFFNHITGFLGSLVILLAFSVFHSVTKFNIAGLPFYAFLGGILGATFVILSNYSFSKTSVITSSVVILAGQFLSSLLFDLIVLKHNLEIKKIIGAFFIIVAVLLYTSSEK